MLAASIRHPVHVVTAARLGCEVSTIPEKVLLARCSTTRSTIQKFTADWHSRPEFAEWLRGLVDERATAKS